MIQNAFVGAYTNQVGALSKGISTISSGVKDAAALALGSAGISGALGEGVAGKAASHYGAGRIGGIGGNIMLATMQEKKETARINQQRQQANIKTLKGLTKQAEELKTPAEILHTSFGDIDPSSELGKRVLEAEEVE